MLSAVVFIYLVMNVLAYCISDDKQVCINIYNNCPMTTWPGIQGSTVPANGGFQLNAGESRQIYVPHGWRSSRIWARTGCDSNFTCETGSCGNKVECEGRGGVPPFSVAEFTLQAGGDQDYYDVSLVNGYNIPLMIIPIPGTFKTNGGDQDCKEVGGCGTDINSVCSEALRIMKNGRTIACKSACLEWNTDEYCCRGAHNTKATCPRNEYAQTFKNCCPTAFSYAYDDDASLFFCRGNNQTSPAAYTVQFC